MDLKELYSLRKDFTIIALTGRTGSGCTEVADYLTRGFIKENYPIPQEFFKEYNNYSRKYKIIYDFAKINFKPYKAIYYKDIIISFILKYKFDEFISFLDSDYITQEFKKSGLIIIPNYKSEIKKLKKYREQFESLHLQAKTLITRRKKSDIKLMGLLAFFQSEEFNTMNSVIHDILKSDSLIKRNKLLQIISSNIRANGNPYKCSSPQLKYAFDIAEVINDLIKAIRLDKQKAKTKIVIDSLRNPLEIMFFRQRYSAFYTFAVNRSDFKRTREIRRRILTYRNKEITWHDIELLLKEEHSKSTPKEFYKQNVSTCIQNADIHLSFKTVREATLFNKHREERKQNISPDFSWEMQLLKFISLIDHPGLITPSPEERCMQLAYTAKYNSGCISRQVGAAITDVNFSIRAIGWNNTAEGQVPCNLRNVNDYLRRTDIFAFTPYERENIDFKEAMIRIYGSKISDYEYELAGQNVCYCFKNIINSYSEGKNQVHTRSLHAEENAFLQISKYGGVGIKDGILFTTASPCELCSKKAYQLGIKVIYYIDPYPGISRDQILWAGEKDRNPKMRLFCGAIGNAYHWLYESIMPYKDELSLILNMEIIDLTAKYKSEIERLNSKIKKLNKIIAH